MLNATLSDLDQARRRNELDAALNLFLSRFASRHGLTDSQLADWLADGRKRLAGQEPERTNAYRD